VYEYRWTSFKMVLGMEGVGRYECREILVSVSGSISTTYAALP
jgi:hypothetical protein